MSLSSETSQVVRLLRTRIRDEGWTLRSVARELGWHEDYLSQLFRGSPELKVEQLFAVLRVVRVAPAAFFADLAGAFAEARPARPAPVAAAPAPAEAGLDLGELEGLIDSRIRRALESLGGAAEPEGERRAGVRTGRGER